MKPQTSSSSKEGESSRAKCCKDTVASNSWSTAPCETWKLQGEISHKFSSSQNFTSNSCNTSSRMEEVKIKVSTKNMIGSVRTTSEFSIMDKDEGKYDIRSGLHTSDDNSESPAQVERSNQPKAENPPQPQTTCINMSSSLPNDFIGISLEDQNRVRKVSSDSKLSFQIEVVRRNSISPSISSQTDEGIRTSQSIECTNNKIELEPPVSILEINTDFSLPRARTKSQISLRSLLHSDPSESIDDYGYVFEEDGSVGSLGDDIDGVDFDFVLDAPSHANRSLSPSQLREDYNFGAMNNVGTSKTHPFFICPNLDTSIHERNELSNILESTP
ncbi:predicted protein [Chaetoceros tenuissimus]|uniref:Uncharacterized protein n=1 Tax=Chaetoceros tenuissimus TaxID=426638 RepID=A0AAD3D4A1_9STRA|nr:predicted protein [Chaetoceros tenuissimus]